MKTNHTIVTALSLCLLASGNTYCETVHQTLRGEDAFSGEGAKAVDKKIMEIKDVPGGKVARVVGSVPQWGYVNYWFGLPSPAGPSILRVKLFVDDSETADYAFYIKKPSGDPLFEKLQIPADAKKNGFVTIDLPVDLPQEWNGLALKKVAKSDKPSPWIDSISVVLP